jgi:hypothetical protein
MSRPCGPRDSGFEKKTRRERQRQCRRRRQRTAAHPRSRGRQRGTDNSATPVPESQTASTTSHREDAKHAKRAMPSIVLSWRSSRLGGSNPGFDQATAQRQRQGQGQRQRQRQRQLQRPEPLARLALPSPSPCPCPCPSPVCLRSQPSYRTVPCFRVHSTTLGSEPETRIRASMTTRWWPETPSALSFTSVGSASRAALQAWRPPPHRRREKPL